MRLPALFWMKSKDGYTIDMTPTKLVGRLEVHSLQWGGETRLQGVLKSGDLKVGKTYLIVEEAN